MTKALQSLFDARAEAERRLELAHVKLASAEITLRRAALEAFCGALAERGIVDGARIMIDGQYSGPWGGKCRDLRHGADPVVFRGVVVDCAPATRPHDNSTDRWWWFRVTIARVKKDGKMRDEYRNFVVKGDTPEDAAREIVAAQ